VGAFKEVTSEPGGTIGDVASTVAREVSHHVAYWQPDHVRAEIRAKRRVLDEHFEGSVANGVATGTCTSCDNYSYPCPTLRLLALPYADREGFRDEWRV
jgi:hypothetical protein